MTRWCFFKDERCPPRFNMVRDAELFEGVSRGTIQGFFRVYNWAYPAVTIGYHQKNFSLADETIAIPIVKRPTGGGAVLHSDDITFSISSSIRSLSSGSFMDVYSRIARVFERAFRSCGLEVHVEDQAVKQSSVCFARTSPMELSLDHRKIMGCAQKVRGEYFLQQGVIPLQVDENLTRRVFGNSLPEIPGGLFSYLPDFSMERFILHLKEAFSSSLNILLVDCHHDDAESNHPDEGEVDLG
ncbi:MAG: lipoate--protein ligase family protein [Desulfomonilia bacterium]